MSLHDKDFTSNLKVVMARVKGNGGWVGKMKGDIVNNVVMSLHSDRKLLEWVGDHIERYKNVEPLYCIQKLI